MSELSREEMALAQGGGDLVNAAGGGTLPVGTLPDIPIFRAPK